MDGMKFQLQNMAENLKQERQSGAVGQVAEGVEVPMNLNAHNNTVTLHKMRTTRTRSH